MKKDKKITNISATKISSFIHLFDKYSLEKLSITDQDLKFTISKNIPSKIQTKSYTPTPYHKDTPQEQLPKQMPDTKQQEKITEDKSKYKIINSPIVGTFYLRPSPDSPLFVGEGSIVTPNTTICIIEAMKMMNEIKAECSGTIAKIIHKDASPVTQNDELFYIKTND